jgi:hypothetical protein
MSLNFDVSRIANHEVVTTHPDNPDLWHPVTEALVWMCTFIDMGGITEANVVEFCERTAIYERCCFDGGSYLKRADPDKGWVPRPLTTAEIVAHIGLSVNVSPRTRPQFMTKVKEYVATEAKSAVAHDIKAINAAADELAAA